jgi:DNA-binding IscR family transcriptional regulator
MQAGADLVLPKPMSREHLLKFLTITINDVKSKTLKLEKQAEEEIARKRAWQEAHDKKAKELEEKLLKKLAAEELRKKRFSGKNYSCQ